MSRDIFLIVFILATASVMVLFGLGVLVYKIVTLDISELKRMLKTPTAVLSSLTVAFILLNLFIKNFFYDFFFIPLVVTPLTVLLISRALTSFVAGWRAKKWAWLAAVFFGIASFFFFIPLIVLIAPDYSGLPHYSTEDAGYFGLKLIALGILTGVVSLIVNMVEMIRKNQRRRSD